MKFLAVLALVTAAVAIPADDSATRSYHECTPPQYACKTDKTGWLVCNVDGTWLNGGVCDKGTYCKPINNLPYCI